MGAMKTNYHTHTTWCDGRDDASAIVRTAIRRGFREIGFSSHAMLPGEMEKDGNLTRATATECFAEIRALAEKVAGEIPVLCGVEADYVPGSAEPSRATYADFKPDYVIGSVHWVVAPDGVPVPVDVSPESLFEGVRDHFAGSAETFVRAYFRAEREMVAGFDFDLAAHPDLVRKFNARHPWFDESASWYLEEIERTADALAQSGKYVEVNTGAIARGWLDEPYPSRRFRDALRDRGVRFVLSSDAHSADAIDAAFDRFASCEDFVVPSWSSLA